MDNGGPKIKNDELISYHFYKTWSEDTRYLIATHENKNGSITIPKYLLDF